jgi:antitoxin YefM
MGQAHARPKRSIDTEVLSAGFAAYCPPVISDVIPRSLAVQCLTLRTNKRTIPSSEDAMTTPVTASEARANLYRLIDEANESHRPVLISGKRSSAVLVSAEDWDAIQETLYLLSVPGMRESIKKGMAEPLEKSAREVKW